MGKNIVVDNKKMHKVFISILTILIIILGIIYTTKFTIKSPEVFLKDNSAALDLDNNNDFSSFKLLDCSLKNNDVFLLSIQSENSVFDLDFKMIKYLNSKAGVNYYISEFSHSIVAYLNKYLVSGDEKYLDYYMSFVSSTSQYGNKQYRDELKNIYDYNKSLPKDKKIKVLGIGAEIFQDVAFKHLNSLIPKNRESEELKEKFKYLCKNTSRNSFENMKVMSLNLQKELSENSEKWRACLKDNFKEFKFVNNNILNSFDNDESNFINKTNYDNFLYFYNKYPKGKYYGLTMGTNALQKQVMNIKGMGALLNQEKSPLKGKIITIECGTSANYNKTINNFIKAPCTLLKLTGINSPFEKNNYAKMFPRYFNDPVKEPITNYFQYVISLQDPERIQWFTQEELIKLSQVKSYKLRGN